MFFLIMVILIILSVLINLFYFMQKIKSLDQSESGKFECGMESLDKTFMISIKFFFLMLIFMLFDIELMFFFPLGLIFPMFKSLKISFFFFFLLIMVLILVYEWLFGGLEWE